MQFLDFELEITVDDEHGYIVAVVHSPAGEARGAFEFPFSSLELEKYIIELQNALLRSGRPPRRKPSPAERAVQDFGRILFDTLFAGEIKSRYDVSRQMAANKDKGLRIKLRIQPAELTALPWEFLYDPRREEYVSLSRNTPIVRYLSLPRPVRPLSITPPLRILGMVASPSDQEPLDVALEQERLRRALQGLETQGLVILDWLEGQSWSALQDVLYQQQYHVFHFIGHGYFDEAEEEGVVVFANRQGRSERFSATKLARLLADHSSLRLAVLNSCEGAKAGEYDVFSSTAATLVRRGLPAVIAMQYDITDDAAITMAGRFYHALGSGLPVDAALSEARKTISFAIENSLEWGTPVLFMRAGDGRIFDIDRAALSAVGELVVPAAEPEPAESIPPSVHAVENTTDTAPKGDGKKWPKAPLTLFAIFMLVALVIGLYGMFIGGWSPPSDFTTGEPNAQPAVALAPTPSDTTTAAVAATTEPAAIATDTPIPPTSTLIPTFTPLAPSIFNGSVPAVLEEGGFTLFGRAQSDSLLEVLVNDAVLGETIADAEGYWTFDVTLDEPGDYLFSVRAIYSDTEVASAGEPVLVIVSSPTPTNAATHTTAATSAPQPPTNTPVVTSVTGKRVSSGSTTIGGMPLTFSWDCVDLPGHWYYEVVAWQTGASSTTSQGVADARMTRDANGAPICRLMTDFDDIIGHGYYYWDVLIVDLEDGYNRITYPRLSEDRRISLDPKGSGSAGNIPSPGE